MKFSALLLTIASASAACVKSTTAPPATDAIFTSINKVNSAVSTLDSLVQKWQKSDGLASALKIQSSYYPLASAASSLNSVAGSVSINVANAPNYVKALNSVVGSISQLLGDLSKKQADFNSIGAAGIVGGDVSTLAPVASQIASKILIKIPSSAPCPAVTSASSIASKLGSAFTAAGKTYSVSVPVFPKAPSACQAYC